MNWIEALKSSNFVWAFLAICTFIGVPLSIYAIISGKRKKQFSYAKTTYQVLSEGKSPIKKLKFSYGDTPIKDLTVTRFTIWNSGKGAIKSENLHKKLPLCIKNSENVQILDASIVAASDENVGFDLMNSEEKANLDCIDDNDIVIKFYCAAEKDGVVVQIIHCGNSDELTPTVNIIDGKKMQAYRMGFIKSGKEMQVYRFIMKAFRFLCYAIIGFLCYAVISHSVSLYNSYRYYKPITENNIMSAMGGQLQYDINAGVESYNRTTVTPNGSGLRTTINGITITSGNDLPFSKWPPSIEDCKKISDQYLDSLLIWIFIILVLIVGIIVGLRIKNNMSIPPKLRKYVKVEITS